jgi:hypothetical protein
MPTGHIRQQPKQKYLRFIRSASGWQLDEGNEKCTLSIYRLANIVKPNSGGIGTQGTKGRKWFPTN